MNKELRVITILATWFGLLILALSLSACRTEPPSTQIGETAKEQISIAYNNLPKECKSPEREREFNLAIKQVDSISRTCEIEKVPLNQRIRYQTVAIYALLSLTILLSVAYLRRRLVS